MWLYLLLVLTCGSLLLSSTTEPFIERASALLTHQQNLSNNLFGTTALVAPGNLNASTQGYGVALSWSEGQSGTGYEVFGAANGTSSACSGATFTSLASTTTASYSDSNRYAPQGTWYCYQVQTTHGEWTSQENNPSAAVQLGFVAASLQLTNGGNTSACGEGTYGVFADLDCGDQIAVTFNQPVNTTTGPGSGDTVCADTTNNTILLGSSTTSGACTSSETVHLGRLTGGTIGDGSSRFAATYKWNTDTVLIVTVGTLVYSSTYPTLSDSTWTLTPATNAGDLLSDSGGNHICDTDADGGNCLPGAYWTSGSSSQPARSISEPTATPISKVITIFTETPTPYVLVTATAILPLPTATSEATITPTYTSTPTTTPLPTDTFTSTPTIEPPTEMPSGTPTGTPDCLPILAETFTPTPTSTPTPGDEPPIQLTALHANAWL